MSAKDAPAPAPADENITDAGRVAFDQGSAPSSSGGLWGAIKNGLSIGEAVPSWPGREGAPVRLGRVKTTLERRLDPDGHSAVWSAGHEAYAVKLVSPKAAPGARDEAAVLRAAAGTDIPVARLIESSRDGSVLVKEFVVGDSADKILARGPFSDSQKQGWAELAAKLIKNGATADLSHGNLVWAHWRTQWTILDGAGLTAAGPREVLSRLLAPEALTRSGVDAGELLSGLRGRLGPDSAAWAGTLAALKSAPELAAPLAALQARDAALPPAPHVVFGRAPKGPAGLDDSVVSYGEVVKRLGWDPLQAKTKYDLHADDPGKLNTRILSAESPGKTPVVVKHAEWRIIRNEVALRRLARRFFGPSFRVPASLAVERGYDSFMVMEKVDGGPAYHDSALDAEQRAAAALFIRTFGVSDVNPGNVLVPRDGGLPWLIDFEQALGRTAPVAGRIPDAGIAAEMPWLSRTQVNRIEDFQPAVRAWRALLAAPESRKGIADDLRAAGFSDKETAELLERFAANAADLDWALQHDVDFVNQFVERAAPRR